MFIPFDLAGLGLAPLGFLLAGSAIESLHDADEGSAVTSAESWWAVRDGEDLALCVLMA